MSASDRGQARADDGRILNVAIIGAGPSGLASGRESRGTGSSAIREARDRVGGRTVYFLGVETFTEGGGHGGIFAQSPLLDEVSTMAPEAASAAESAGRSLAPMAALGRLAVMA